MAKSILFKLSLDSTAFRSGLTNAENSLKRAEKAVGNIGKNLSTYVTAPLAALGTMSVMAWDKQAKAMAQVETGLRTTGGAAGFAKDELLSMASELQGKTLFGDEEILQSATAQLLTFTSVAGEQFARAQAAALDLSTRLNTDLKSSAIMVGKALNDPIQGLTAMRRVGIQFTEDQQAMIRAMVDSGQVMEAQKVILSELERQYGGSAEAAVVGAGKLVQLKNILGDISEEFGRIIMEALDPFIEKIKVLATGFFSLDESTKRTIVVVAGLAAAIGPALLAITGLIKVTRIMITTLSALASPVTLVVAGIAALAAGAIYLWQNWDAMKERISDWGWWRNMLIGMVQFLAKMAPQILDMLTYPLRKVAEIFGIEFPTLTSALDPLISKLDLLKTEPKKYENSFGSFGAAMKGAVNDAGKALGLFASKSKDGLDEIKSAAIGATQAVAGIGSGGEGGTGGSASAPPVLSAMGNKKSFDPALWGDIAKDAIARKQSGSQDFESDKLMEYADNYQAMADRMGETSMRLQETMQMVGNAVGDVFSNMGYRIVDSLGLAEHGFQGFARMMIQTVTQLVSMFLAQSIASAIAGASQSAAATGPLAIFTQPAFIATAVGGILAAFAAIPKFAQGGLAYGPMLAMVGDNPNAKADPEIIAPLSKLRGMMGFSETGLVQDRIELDGEKMYVLFKRVERNKYRRT